MTECVVVVSAASARSSADVVKAIALGADAVYIATARFAGAGLSSCAALVRRARCNWGIATQVPRAGAAA